MSIETDIQICKSPESHGYVRVPIFGYCVETEPERKRRAKTGEAAPMYAYTAIVKRENVR